MKYLFILSAILALGVVAWYWQNNNEQSLSLFRNDGAWEEDLTTLPDEALAFVQATEVVELKDGDTLDLVASVVKQEVGGRVIKRLAYNGQIPGPVIKVQKGANVTINLTNKLGMDTALHSHGVRGDWQMDGAAPLTPVVKDGEIFSYQLKFPDTGVFWYHPHVREDYQQELGLYGNFIVEEDGYWNDVKNEAYLIFDDFLDNKGFSRAAVTNTLMGRYGNVFLINNETDFELKVNQGEVTRVFMTNAANTRVMDIKYEGALVKLVGGDIGRVEHEQIIDDVVIAPAERYVLELYYKNASTYSITHRGRVIGKVTVVPGNSNEISEFNKLRDNSADYSAIRENQTELLAKTPDKKLRFDVAMTGMMSENSDSQQVSLMGTMMSREAAVEHCKMMPEMNGCEPYVSGGEDEHGASGIEWEDGMAAMNNMSTDKTLQWIIEDEETGKQNDAIDWSFKEGALVKVRVYNDPNTMHPMQHPLHFHGQRFVVLARDGIANTNLEWKDTVLIPKGETVDLLVDMSNPGKWMAHCHIAEHLHAGMMLHFTVE